MSGKKISERMSDLIGMGIQIAIIGEQKIKNDLLSSSKDKDKPQENASQVKIPPKEQNLPDAPIPEEKVVDPPPPPSQEVQIKAPEVQQEQKQVEDIGESTIKIQKPLSKQGESESEEQPNESNISELSKFGKKQKNDESNSQRKQELPSSRKCFNKLCTSKKIYKKIRSRVEDNKYRFFCKNCYENYYNNLYCEFCEQIYSNSCENEDDDKWIGCDNCERWNHIECQKRVRDKNINDLKDKNLLYQCLVCSLKSKNNQAKNKNVDKDEEKVMANKQKIEINKDQRVLIFHKKYESFPNLQYFLQNYSFRLWMNEGQIRQDLEYLRSNCVKAPQEEISKGKLKKIKNQ